MSNKNLTIEFRARTDKDGRVFYVGKLKAPCLIDCKDGVVFLAFTAEEGAEELQICTMDQKDDNSF
jgi:hypothetical protein